MKKNLTLKLIGILIFAVLFIFPVSAAQTARENGSFGLPDLEETVYPDPVPDEGAQKISSDALLYEYLDRELLGTGELPPDTVGSIDLGGRLEKTNKIVYSSLYKGCAKIAAGEETSTILSVDLLSSEYAGKKWFAEDLGIESIGTVEDGSFVPSADFKQAFYSAIGYNMSAVMTSLLRDCPCEMYWFGQNYSSTVPYKVFRQASDGVLYARIADSMTVKIYASADYAMPGKGQEKTETYKSQDGTQTFEYDPYTIDPGTLDAVNSAIGNAKKIVADNPYTNDYDTLYYYFDKVTGLSGYNYAATQYYPSDYGNPWQVIYLFDGDSSTKVVCEGFSKGMQYLCDMTDFEDGGIWCSCVTGDYYNAKTGSKIGYHMWNILHMDDGENYLIDATNSSASAPWGFLAGNIGGSVKDGYVVDERYRYEYSEKYTLSVYTEEELTLAGSSYTQSAPFDLSAKISGAAVTLTWKQDTKADGFLVYKSEDGKEFKQAADVRDAKTYTEKDLKPGAVYYRVTSYFKDRPDGDHESKPSRRIPVYLFAAGPEMEQIRNTPLYTAVSWKTDPEADGTILYRSTDGQKFKRAKVIAGNEITSWTDSKAGKNGKPYYYKAASYKVVDGIRFFSPASEVKTVIRLDRPAVTMISASLKKVTIGWDRSEEADGFCIYRSTDGGAFIKIKTVTSSDAGSYTDQALLPGKTFAYRVTAYKNDKDTIYESAASATKEFALS